MFSFHNDGGIIMKLSFLQRWNLAIAFWGISLTSFPAAAFSTTVPVVPGELKVPEEFAKVIKIAAKGVQIYTCKSTPETAGVYQWVLKGPEAQLYDEQGKPIGTHYAGPTWELKDGSKVAGKVAAKAQAPDKNTIPWLLLATKAPAEKVSGTVMTVGQLTGVKWIHRINTVGGQAPQSGCDRAHQNREVRVQYSADYYFYSPPATSANL
jgi:Protein of unknown function (DUF3455)